MASPTTDTPPDLRRNGLGMGAIAFAVLATLLAVYALGVSLATRNGTGASGASVASVDAAAAPAAAEGAASELSVELSEFAITPTDLEVAAGGSLAVANTGAIDHNLKVKDTDVATADLAGGESETLDLASLEAGTYDIWCDIAGHETAGMTGTLTIADGAAEATSDDEA